MSPTIRIDDEVYAWLQGQAKPFEDTPNSVLRRIASLDKEKVRDSMDEEIKLGKMTANELNQKWGVQARHALYHHGGIFFNILKEFPGALFDPHGYVLFNTENEYRDCPFLRIGQRTNVRRGISSLPNYVRKG